MYTLRSIKCPIKNQRKGSGTLSYSNTKWKALKNKRQFKYILKLIWHHISSDAFLTKPLPDTPEQENTKDEFSKLGIEK